MSTKRLTPPQSRYFDAWRGGSAITVLIGHSFEIFQPNPLPIWGAASTAAVMIFLVLSGYFIQKSLASNMARGTPVAFVAARVNRILPPFLFAIILTAALWAIAPAVFLSGCRNFLNPISRPGFSIDGLLPTTLFLNGFAGPTLQANGPLWSLSFEVWYYALAFIFAMRWRVLGLAIAAVLVWRNHDFAVLSLAWLLGYAISAFQHHLPIWRWPIVLPLIVLPPFLILEYHSWLMLAWYLSVAAAFASHMALMIQRNPPTLSFLPSTADWSYTLYVVHYPLLLFVYGVTENSALLIPAMLGTALFAAGSAKIIERLKPWPVSPRRADFATTANGPPAAD